MASKVLVAEKGDVHAKDKVRVGEGFRELEWRGGGRPGLDIGTC